MRIHKCLLILLSAFLLVNCEKEEKEDIEEYTILSGACGTIILIDNIGTDYFTALDSLKSIRESFVGNNFYVEERELKIDFNFDNREFKGIIFKYADTHLTIFSMSDVLDTYGNYYYINWCPD